MKAKSNSPWWASGRKNNFLLVKLLTSKGENVQRYALWTMQTTFEADIFIHRAALKEVSIFQLFRFDCYKLKKALIQLKTCIAIMYFSLGMNL